MASTETTSTVTLQAEHDRIWAAVDRRFACAGQSSPQDIVVRDGREWVLDDEEWHFTRYLDGGVSVRQVSYLRAPSGEKVMFWVAGAAGEEIVSISGPADCLGLGTEEQIAALERYVAAGVWAT